MKTLNYITIALICFMVGACAPEREAFPLPEDKPQGPVGDRLYEVLRNPASDYNAIAIDPLHPDLPDDFMQRWQQAVENVRTWVLNGTDGRELHSMLIHFGEDDVVTVAAYYNVRSTSPQALATWTYNMHLDEDGIGKLEFVQQNGNGSNLAPQIMDVLAYFLEDYTFKVDWVDEETAQHPDPAVKLGGFFRTDNNASYVFGKLVKVNTLNITSWPLPTTPSLDRFFKIANPIDQQYYTSVLVDPDDEMSSPAFKALWGDVRTSLKSSGNREISHFKWVFDSRFERMRMTIYYLTSTGAKTGTFYRYVPVMDYEDGIRFIFNSEDGNGALIRDARLMDDFIESHRFVMTETTSAPSGNDTYVTFTSTTDPSLYFSGKMGNLAANCCGDWTF